jgi:succinyl-diaminopimelate desuccinylase
VQTLAGLKDTVTGILTKHRIKHSLEWYVSGEPFFTPPGTLCEAVSAAVAAVTGSAPQRSTGGGTSDGRFIAPRGAQVVELGVVHATIHKVNECVRLSEIEALHRMYVGVLENLLT